MYPFAKQGIYDVVPRPYRHKTKGLLALLPNQKFVPYFRPDGSLQRLEIHETRHQTIYRVITYLSKAICKI